MSAFPFRAPIPQRFAGPVPEAADVVVIGGGVIGVTTALYLARDGHRVALLEKGRIAAEQSSRNWGWIRQQGRDPDELPIMMEAIGLWQDLAAECAVDIGLHQGGVTYFAETEKDLAGFANWQTMAADHDLDTRMLSSRETAAMFPDLAQRYPGAMVTPSDMRAEPWLAVPALADLAAAERVKIIENCAVRCLDLAGGKVAGRGYGKRPYRCAARGFGRWRVVIAVPAQSRGVPAAAFGARKRAVHCAFAASVRRCRC